MRDSQVDLMLVAIALGLSIVAFTINVILLLAKYGIIPVK
jgi:hypothetical protein